MQSDRTHQSHSPSTWSVARRVIREDGGLVKGLLGKGITATIGRNGSFNMIYFGFYHTVKNKVVRKMCVTTLQGGAKETPHLWRRFDGLFTEIQGNDIMAIFFLKVKETQFGHTWHLNESFWASGRMNFGR